MVGLHRAYACTVTANSMCVMAQFSAANKRWNKNFTLSRLFLDQIQPRRVALGWKYAAFPEEKAKHLQGRRGGRANINHTCWLLKHNTTWRTQIYTSRIVKQQQTQPYFYMQIRWFEEKSKKCRFCASRGNTPLCSEVEKKPDVFEHYTLKLVISSKAVRSKSAC